MLFDKDLEASPVLAAAGIDMGGMTCVIEGFMFMNRERDCPETPRVPRGDTREGGIIYLRGSLGGKTLLFSIFETWRRGRKG